MYLILYLGTSEFIKNYKGVTLKYWHKENCEAAIHEMVNNKYSNKFYKCNNLPLAYNRPLFIFEDFEPVEVPDE